MASLGDQQRPLIDPFTRLHGFTMALSEVVSFPKVAQVVLERTCHAAEAGSATLAYLVPAGTSLDVRTADGERRSVPLDDASPYAEVTRTGEPRFLDQAEGTLAILPLTVRNRTQGALGLSYAHPRAFSPDERSFLLTLAHQCAMALERSLLHQAESDAREQAEDEAHRFRSLVQELHAIFWEGDPATFQFTFVSKRAEDVLGYPLRRWTDEPDFWTKILHPEDRHWAVDFCVACTKQGEDHAFEYRAIAADGRTVWLRDVVYVVRDEDDKPVKLRGVMMDITKERLAQRSHTTQPVAHVIPRDKPRTSSVLPSVLRRLERHAPY